MRDAIKYIYPDIQDSQFDLQDDGAGPYIKRWDYSQPAPTQAEIDAATPKAAIPRGVSLAQAQLALLQKGYLDQVESIISAQGRAAQIEWQCRQVVERSHPLVELVKTQLPLTEDDLDELFTIAETL